MAVMAKEPKRPAASADRDPISYRPSQDVARGLAEYLGRFKVKPGKSAVIERAMREFLRAEGIDITLEDEG